MKDKVKTNLLAGASSSVGAAVGVVGGSAVAAGVSAATMDNEDINLNNEAMEEPNDEVEVLSAESADGFGGFAPNEADGNDFVGHNAFGGGEVVDEPDNVYNTNVEANHEEVEESTTVDVEESSPAQNVDYSPASSPAAQENVSGGGSSEDDSQIDLTGGDVDVFQESTPDPAYAEDSEDVQVEVLSVNTVQTDDGEMDIAEVKVDGEQAYVVDADRDGMADAIVVDGDGDGYITDDEVVDISQDDISMEPFTESSPIEDSDVYAQQSEDGFEEFADMDPNSSDYVNDANVDDYIA